MGIPDFNLTVAIRLNCGALSRWKTFCTNSEHDRSTKRSRDYAGFERDTRDSRGDADSNFHAQSKGTRNWKKKPQAAKPTLCGNNGLFWK